MCLILIMMACASGGLTCPALPCSQPAVIRHMATAQQEHGLSSTEAPAQQQADAGIAEPPSRPGSSTADATAVSSSGRGSSHASSSSGRGGSYGSAGQKPRRPHNTNHANRQARFTPNSRKQQQQQQQQHNDRRFRSDVELAVLAAKDLPALQAAIGPVWDTLTVMEVNQALHRLCWFKGERGDVFNELLLKLTTRLDQVRGLFGDAASNALVTTTDY